MSGFLRMEEAFHICRLLGPLSLTWKWGVLEPFSLSTPAPPSEFSGQTSARCPSKFFHFSLKTTQFGLFFILLYVILIFFLSPNGSSQETTLSKSGKTLAEMQIVCSLKIHVSVCVGRAAFQMKSHMQNLVHPSSNSHWQMA